MYLKWAGFIIVFIICSTSILNIAIAQHNTSDSLEIAYQKTQNPNLLLYLAHSYCYRDLDKADTTYKELIKIATLKQDTTLLVHSYILYGLYVMYAKNQSSIQRDNYNRALTLLNNKTTSQAIADINLIKGLIAYQNISSVMFADQSVSHLDTNALTYFYESIAHQNDSFFKALAFEYLYYYRNTYFSTTENIAYKGVGENNFEMDSALYYYKLCNNVDAIAQTTYNIANTYIYECYKKNAIPAHCQKIDSLLANSFTLAQKTDNLWVQARNMNILAYKELKKNNYAGTIHWVKKAESLAKKMNDNNQLLRYLYTYNDMYYKQKDYKSLFFCYNKIKQFRDSLDLRNNIEQMAYVQNTYENQTRDIKIKVLNDENLLKQKEIRQSRFIFIFIIALFVVIIISFIVFTYQRHKLHIQFKKNEQLNKLLQTNLENQLNNVQQQALRSQMNPHFIFNALSSIQNLILQEDKTKAVNYLQNFAQMSRLTLEHSLKEQIKLKEEISFLSKYLQLEQLRYKSVFQYFISKTADVDDEFETVPPMLLQPFIENAIKHGLVPKKEKGNLTIHFFMQNTNNSESLVCHVDDDGIGRKKSLTNKTTGHKSIATELSQLRVELLSKKEEQKAKYSIEIIDKTDEQGHGLGTKIIIIFGTISS